MTVQGPPLRALSVSPCIHEGRRSRPYPVTGGGRQDPQLPRRLAYPSPIQRAVGRSQGLGAPAPQPVGASGQLGKEQALPCAENLFSRCGVRLGEYDGTPHGGTCPSNAELPEFLQRQECGTTETVSEAPGAYGISSCSHAARTPMLLGKHVLVRTDNTAAVSYINRLGGIRSHRMSHLARHLLLWTHTQFKSLRAVPILGKLNRAADALLRQLTFPGEW